MMPNLLAKRKALESLESPHPKKQKIPNLKRQLSNSALNEAPAKRQKIKESSTLQSKQELVGVKRTRKVVYQKKKKPCFNVPALQIQLEFLINKLYQPAPSSSNFIFHPEIAFEMIALLTLDKIVLLDFNVIQNQASLFWWLWFVNTCENKIFVDLIKKIMHVQKEKVRLEAFPENTPFAYLNILFMQKFDTMTNLVTALNKQEILENLFNLSFVPAMDFILLKEVNLSPSILNRFASHPAPASENTPPTSYSSVTLDSKAIHITTMNELGSMLTKFKLR